MQRTTPAALLASEPFDESKSRELILDRKFAVNWKTAAAGAVGIALIVGSLLWLRRDETDFSQIPMANQLPPESVAAPRLVGVGVNAERTEINPREVLNLSLKAQYGDGTQNEIKEGVKWASSDRRGNGRCGWPGYGSSGGRDQN